MDYSVYARYFSHELLANQTIYITRAFFSPQNAKEVPAETSTETSAYEYLRTTLFEWTGPGLNRRHLDFQSSALPTELPVLDWQ